MYSPTTNQSNTNGVTYPNMDFYESVPPNPIESQAPTVPGETVPQESEEPAQEQVSCLNLRTSNVVVMANLRCHINLKHLARVSVNVEYKPVQNHVIMRNRRPFMVATIWSSGKIWCTGASSVKKAKIGARRIARKIMRAGFPCRFCNYRIINIMAGCRLPFRVSLESLVTACPSQMSYEPELSPGLNFKSATDSSTSLKVFSSGSIVVMGSSLDSISGLVEELAQYAFAHSTDGPVSDSDEDEEFDRDYDSEVAGFHSHRSLKRRRRSRKGGAGRRRRNYFSEWAAKSVPALADVFLEELEEDELEDKFEEDFDDRACTDNDSEEEEEEEYPAAKKRSTLTSAAPTAPAQPVIQPVWGTQVQTTISRVPPASIDNVRSGVKRARISAYSDQPATHPVIQQQQPQFIIANSTNMVPLRFAAAPGTSFQPQQQQYTLVSPGTKVVQLTGGGGQPSIVRLVHPQTIVQQHQPATRFVIARLAPGTTLVNPIVQLVQTVPSQAPSSVTSLPQQPPPSS